MSRIDPTPYLDAARARLARQREQDHTRAADARARLPQAVAALVALGATRVLLFGSLLDGALHERSDVDLAVTGLSAAALGPALTAVTAALGRDVDLVALDQASPTLRARILAEGQVLHG